MPSHQAASWVVSWPRVATKWSGRIPNRVFTGQFVLHLEVQTISQQTSCNGKLPLISFLGKPMGCRAPAPTCNAPAQCHLLSCTNGDVQELKPSASNTPSLFTLMSLSLSVPAHSPTKHAQGCQRGPHSHRIGRQVSVGRKQSSDSLEQKGLLGFLPQLVESRLSVYWPSFPTRP